MTRKKPSRRQMQSLCAEIRDDDGIDPRDFFRTTRKRRGNNRKDLQLCRQVAETLNLVLSGELNDEILRTVQVIAVTPARDASQLMVLAAPLPGETPNANDVRSRLNAVAGVLRSAVASAVTRRRAPKLLFQFLTADFPMEERP